VENWIGMNIAAEVAQILILVNQLGLEAPLEERPGERIARLYVFT
jgi:hypothetical protein